MSASVQLFDPRIEHLFAMRTPLLRTLRMAGGTYTVGDIADGILAGKFQFWMRPNSGIVTEVIAYPRKRVLNYFLVFGELDECLSMQPEIEAFAKEHGCTAVACAGRAGWERVLPAHGWRRLWTVMAKDLA